MASYAAKQLFKKRFWKHIWELDSESLRDLLDGVNPIGNVTFQFRVPSDHGYRFQPAYDGSTPKDPINVQPHVSFNEAIESYLYSGGETAAVIVLHMLHSMGTGFLTLPCGAIFDECLARDIILEIVMILWEHGGLDEFDTKRLFAHRACQYQTTYNTDMGKRLWKLRLVQMDRAKWPTTTSFGDVSTAQLQALYEGHPQNVNFHKVELDVSDRPVKKAKP
tara:strand:+ start:181 stop:843 length:663 start_codon:yes stop_codon:yes gene_type:complete